MQTHTKTILKKSNILRFIVIKAKYERARFFYRRSGGKVSWRRIMEEVEVKEATAKRWEEHFKTEWSPNDKWYRRK